MRGSRSLAVGLVFRYTQSWLAVGTGNHNLDIPQCSPAPNLHLKPGKFRDCRVRINWSQSLVPDHQEQVG
jgi:hypothetical protein